MAVAGDEDGAVGGRGMRGVPVAAAVGQVGVHGGGRGPGLQLVRERDLALILIPARNRMAAAAAAAAQDRGACNSAG